MDEALTFESLAVCSDFAEPGCDAAEAGSLAGDPDVVEFELVPVDADADESELASPGAADACPAPVITAAPRAIAKANADTSRVADARYRPGFVVFAARAFALARFLNR